MRGAIVAAAACVAVASVFLPGAAEGAAPLCNPHTCVKSFCGTHASCGSLQTCALVQNYYCATGEPTGEPSCALTDTWGQCAAHCETYDFQDLCNATYCPLGQGGPEVCWNLIDENYSGCINEGARSGSRPARVPRVARKSPARPCRWRLAIPSTGGERSAST